MPRDPASAIRLLLSGPDVNFEELVAPDARLSTFMRPKPEMGPDAARRYWTETKAFGWTLTIEIDSVEVRADKALASGRLHARRGPIDDTNEVIWGCRVEEGLVQELCAFIDPGEAVEWFSR